MNPIICIAYPATHIKLFRYPANKGTKTNPLYQTIDMDMICVHKQKYLY
jgi:hypothetical protein